MSISIKTINWGKTMEERLSNALIASRVVLGRSLRDAVKQAIIFMIQSARKLTPKAKRRRDVFREGKQEYVLKYYQRKEPAKIYKWHFKRSDGTYDLDGWNKARLIKNAGLAKRSWSWGLKFFGKNPEGKPMETVTLQEIKTKDVFGYVLRNKLDYLGKIMPAGWESDVKVKTTNRIIKMVEQRIARKAKRDLSAAFNMGLKVGRSIWQ